MNLLVRPVRSSLGRKYVMAITGLLLTGFVLVHMAGNLLLFAGPDALNSYAHALKDKPVLLWTARFGLLTVFLIHVYLGITLTRENNAARPVRYAYERTLQASWASRHMMLTGLLLLAFILYHLAHFTFGVVVRAEVPEEGRTIAVNYLDLKEAHDPARPQSPRHDVYHMVVSGFKNPWITGSYLLAMVVLALHLWHGGSSWLQSLGLTSPNYRRGLGLLLGPVLASVVFVGNCSMPLAVLLGLVK